MLQKTRARRTFKGAAVLGKHKSQGKCMNEQIMMEISTVQHKFQNSDQVLFWILKQRKSLTVRPESN